MRTRSKASTHVLRSADGLNVAKFARPIKPTSDSQMHDMTQSRAQQCLIAFSQGLSSLKPAVAMQQTKRYEPHA